MQNWARLTPAATVDRNDDAPGTNVIDVVELSLSWSWGAQPAQATLAYTVGTSDPAASISSAIGYVAPVGAYAELVISTGTTEAHRFHGIVISDQGVDSSQGKDRVLQFRDLRELLTWDQVFCAFNIPDVVSYIDGSTVLKRRRWKHLLPANWATNSFTFTDAPLTAVEICGYLFGAGTVESPWSAQYHPAMASLPVLNLDFTSGVTLAAALTQVCDPIGMVFTLWGKWVLRFRRKGELLTTTTSYSPADPNMPWAAAPFPLNGSGNPVWPLTAAGQPAADQVRDGLLVTSNPTRIRVIGDRNLYQVLNLTLVPDWAPGWQEFWDEQVFLNWVYTHVEAEPGVTFEQLPTVNVGDDENVIGWQQAAARAAELTVAQVAALREAIEGDGEQFADFRLLGGQARMQMPALLYLRQILWRAYRLPDVILGRPATAFQLTDRQLMGVAHDSAGVMTAAADQPLDGAGYVIARGVGFQSQTALRALNPDRFRLADWVEANATWSVQSFGVDPDGGNGIGFIILDSPVFQAEEAFTAIASGDLTMAVANAAAGLEAAPVKAALTLAGEKYVFTWPSTPPSQQKDAVQNESGLHAELVYDAGGTLIGSIDYADGQGPDEKAEVIATSALIRQWTYRLGGYQRILQTNDAGVRLNGLLDRVSISVSPGGITESVDFTAERASAEFVPDRFFERSIRDANLFNGQRELRQQAREGRALAAALRANPGFIGTIVAGFHDLIGGGPVSPAKVIPDTSGSPPITLAAGTPLWRRSNETTAVLPAEVNAAHDVLVGVTVRDLESSNHNLPVANSGRTLIRVYGGATGVAVGALLGRAPGSAYLAEVEDNPVAVARAAVPAGEVRLIWCDIGSGGGGGGGGGGGSIPDTIFWGTGRPGQRLYTLQDLQNLGFSEERADFLRPDGFEIGYNPENNTYGFFAFPDSWGTPVAFEVPGNSGFTIPLTYGGHTGQMAGSMEGYGAHEESGLRFDRIQIGDVAYRVYRTKTQIWQVPQFQTSATDSFGSFSIAWPLVLDGIYVITQTYDGSPMTGYDALGNPETRSFNPTNFIQHGAPNNLVGTTFRCTSRGTVPSIHDQWWALDGVWFPDPSHFSYAVSQCLMLASRWYIRAERTESPTFAPPAGDYSSFPMNVTMDSATAGAEVTFKVFDIGDPSEPVTPGNNGWSAYAAVPASVSVTAGKEIRVQARASGMAASGIVTAAYT